MMADSASYIEQMKAAFGRTRSNEERIWGPPGTGKSTTVAKMVVEAAKQYGSDKVTVASFTKAAAVELVSRNMPIDSDRVGTLHALCFRALGMPPIAETRMSEWNAEFPSHTMTASAAGNDDPSWDMSSRTETDRMMASYQTQRSRLIDSAEMQYEGIFDHPDFVDFTTKWEAWKQANGYLDFTDMLSVSLRDFDTAPGDPSIMFLDESQDLAPLELALARKWAKAMDRLIVAGDDDQALYSFKGADPQTIFKDAPRSEEVLSQSYRVPRAVHALANAWIKQLSWRVDKEYLPRAAEGFAKTLWAADFGNPGPAVEQAKNLIADGKTVMFLASCSYMLRGTIATLREEGVPFHNPMKVRRGDWNPLAVGTEGRKTATDRVMAFCKVRPDVFGSDAHVWTADEFRLWASEINGKDLFKRGVKSQIASRDFSLPPGDAARIEAISALLRPDAAELPDQDHFGNALEGNLAWLMSRLAGETGQRMRYPATIAQKMGPRTLLEKPKVTVGTIHSVKGGEADCSPGDEPVLTTNRGWVPIGDLDPFADSLVSFNSDHHKIHRGGPRRPNGFAFAKASRLYSGDLLTIETDASRTRVTPNHHLTVRWSRAAMGAHCVYLMRRGSWWRIGVTQLHYTGGGQSGVLGRMRREKATDAWVLGVFDVRRDALYHEQMWSHVFGVPDLNFECDARNENQLGTAALHEIWPMLDSESGAIRLLTSLGMSTDWPLWSFNGEGRRIRQTAQRNRWTTRAANLIPGYMEIPTDPGHGLEPLWLPFTVSRALFSGEVFSLDVERWHHYVSGGAVVHNCVFLYPDISWAGQQEWEAIGPRSDSVRRLFYVAMTRAREGLYLCGNSGQHHVKPWEGLKS